MGMFHCLVAVLLSQVKVRVLHTMSASRIMW